MKVSAFTFLRNADKFDYPFIESIKSVISMVDEFVIALGPSDEDDNTEEKLLALNEPKIRIIKTTWNEKMKTRGFVYAQQKSIAYYNCTGDWAFYIEADEVVHEKDLEKIYSYMEKYKDDPEVEGLAFKYRHFYGNADTYLWSPAWYKKEIRIMKTSVRSFPPDGLFFVVFADNRNTKLRYPKAVTMDVLMYHYGWVRPPKSMELKFKSVDKYWDQSETKQIDYKNIDKKILRKFTDSHPQVVQNWLKSYNLLGHGIFKTNKDYKLTKKDKKHRLLAKIEKMFNLDLAKHFYKELKR